MSRRVQGEGVVGREIHGIMDLRSTDGVFVALQLAAAILRLSLSTLYQTGLDHSAPVAHLWLQLDHGGFWRSFLGAS